MASLQGYFILIVGISFLLALGGVQTTGGKVVGLFYDVQGTNPTSNLTVDSSNFWVNSTGTSGNWVLKGLMISLLLFAALSGYRAYLGGTFGIAETLKAGIAAIILPLIIADFISIITWVGNINVLGGVIKFLVWAIYIPLSIGAIIAIIDWIGGGR